MVTKNWLVAEAIPQEILGSIPGIDPVLLQLLWNRGLKDPSAIREFINVDWSTDIKDPYLFKDMTTAVQRIYEAIGNQEVIGVYGDYDADGVCAAVIIVSTLKKLGARVEVYLPHREKEGYGLNQEAIRYLKEKNVSLLITCDCGIANITEVDFANSLGITVIITDHHQPQNNLPAAFAILHPGLLTETYPFRLLSGGGVAFKLIQGLLRYEGCHLSTIEQEAQEKWLTDLVAISTIADMVKLVGENRTLVTYGLKTLMKTKNLGLKKIMTVAGITPDKIDSQTVSWQLAPRINAAGRMDHANSAYAMLTTTNSVEAEELARSVNLANMQRQKITEEMIKEAESQIGDITDKEYFIHAFKADWSLGLVGLVAGKLVQKYNRPALVMCQMGEKIFGSARSGVGDFDLADAFKKSADDLLSFGGHKEAAGFSLLSNKLDAFLSRFKAIAMSELKNKDLSPVLLIDKELAFSEISIQLAEQLGALEPHGQGNLIPKFASLGVKIADRQPVGNQGQYLRLVLTQGQTTHRFIWFKPSATAMQLSINDTIDVAYEMGLNQWNGNKSIELKIIDIRQLNL